jgi:hypothetical protein
MDAEIIYDEVPQKAFPMISGSKEAALFFFAPQEVTLNFGPFMNGRVYFNEQDGPYTPIVSGGNNCAISEPSECISSQYVGKSNSQLNAQYGKSFCGEITPTSVLSHPMIIGGKIQASALSLDNLDATNLLQVYPNPSKDGIFQIDLDSDLEISQLMVFNLSGQNLMKADLGESRRIDLSCMPSGFYIIKFLSSKNSLSITKKVIIK